MVDEIAPVVSVIMAAYNASRFVEGAIQSALSQTLTDVEVLVVNDCSSDDTAEIVGRMEAADRRVRLVNMPKNGGPGAARKLGVSEARGQWIAVQDADDKMLPDRLERLVAVCRDNGFHVVADNLNYVDEDTGERFGLALPMEGAPAISTISAEQFVLRNLPGETGFKLGFLKPLVSRAFLQEHAINYHEELRVAEDYQFLFDILAAGARFGFIAEPMYDYVIRPDSVSHTYSETDLLHIAEMNRRNAVLPEVTGNSALLAAVKRRQLYCDRNAAYVRLLGRIRDRKPAALLATVAQTAPYMPYFAWRLVRVFSEGRVWSSTRKRS